MLIEKHSVLILKGEALPCSVVSLYGPREVTGVLVNAGVSVGCRAGAEISVCFT